jgi:cyclopropane fatty-acyl-phospholipid synthase-like methyltransferase
MAHPVDTLADFNRLARQSFFDAIRLLPGDYYPDFVTTLKYAPDDTKVAFYRGLAKSGIYYWEELTKEAPDSPPEAIQASQDTVAGVVAEIATLVPGIDTNPAPLQDLSEGERQVLIAVLSGMRGRDPTDAAALEIFGRKNFFRYLVDWENAFGALVEKGLLKSTGGQYALTTPGIVYANLIQREHPLWLYFYNELYLRAEESPTHAEMCTRLYGQNLCQQGQMDMDQLHALLDILNLSADSRVLELGCGTGHITEYIAGQTGAHISGIDVAYEAIAHALARTAKQRGRLDFLVVNMNTIQFPVDSFDAIIAIDSIHIGFDLKEILRRMKLYLKPGGQMAIFWETWLPKNSPSETFLPENSRLGVALTELRLQYQAHDFTTENNRFWERAITTLDELKSQFDAEGNQILYEANARETNRYHTRKGCRYLYHVKV